MTSKAAETPDSMRISDEELARLKAIAFDGLESEFDSAFWSDGGKTVQALITTIERYRTELNECRRLLADVIGSTPHDALTSQSNRTSIKAAADWLANWDDERL